MDGRPDRREAKKFEPPPWERDSFDELARQRADEAAEEDLARAINELTGAESEAAGDAQPEGRADAVPEEQVGPAESVEANEEKTGTAGEIDQAQLTEMLANLSIEEPSSVRDVYRLGVLGALASIAVGVMLLVWGVVAFIRSTRDGQANAIETSVFGSAGMAFIGIGAWIVVRTRNLRGDL